MKRIFQSVFVWVLILSACSAGLSSPQPVSVSTTETPTLVPITAGLDPTLIVTLATPHIEQPPGDDITAAPPNPQDCGFQWAEQDLLELSSSFQQSVQALQTEAKANAYIFGENCIHPDGSIGYFSARETDFNITLQVNDLDNESDLGAWIVKVMQIITSIPPDQIVGPIPGMVFLIFQSGSEQRAISFSIDEFQKLPSNLSDGEVFQALQPQ